MTAHVDTLANVERPAGDRPEPRPDEGSASHGHWLGSAAQWRTRAIVAETRIAALRAALTGWRTHT
jgi:hypothetical protein